MTIVDEATFRAMLDWFMCSDPWPVSDDGESHATITNWLDNESIARGYSGWVEAYHYFDKEDSK